jgi:hypothetical protein
VAEADALAESADEENSLDRALAELRTTISAGDLLRAEIQTSALLALLYIADVSAAETALLIEVYIGFATKELRGPTGPAYLRLFMSLGPQSAKRKASEALAELIADGVYPPEWVTSIGRPTPGHAWRLYDVTGDRELIVVTYRYEDAEHGLLVVIDLAELPIVGGILIGEDADDMISTLRDQAKPWDHHEQITVAEARRHIEPALTRAEEWGFDPADASVLFLPLAKSRVRRLPSDDLGDAVVYTAADRAAAVDEFLRSTDGADAADPETARFWAQVLTGYSSRRPGEPPAQVGSQRLAAILLVHVTTTFTLSAVLHDGLRSAVTAWAHWAAVHQGLDEEATEHLTAGVPQLLDEFEDAYDDPEFVVARGYVRDLVTGDTDVAWLADQRARRAFAVPLPDERDAEVADIDASDPDGRAAVTMAEFAHCGPDGPAGKEFAAAAVRVVEEIWRDDPAQTWQEATRLAAKGLDRHDLIHALADDAHGDRA